MQHKDWTGNAKSVFVRNGVSNHTDDERQIDDYYATEPKATQLLLDKIQFSNVVWECACGGGHMSEVLKQNGYSVYSTDLVDRGYEDTIILDFLKFNTLNNIDIITNLPYKYAKEFVEHALDISSYGVKIAMFLKLTFLEGKARKKLFEKYPPKYIYVFRNRMATWNNGNEIDPNTGKRWATTMCHAWFIWEKGSKTEPVVRWL